MGRSREDHSRAGRSREDRSREGRSREGHKVAGKTVVGTGEDRARRMEVGKDRRMEVGKDRSRACKACRTMGTGSNPSRGTNTARTMVGTGRSTAGRKMVEGMDHSMAGRMTEVGTVEVGTVRKEARSTEAGTATGTTAAARSTAYKARTGHNTGRKVHSKGSKVHHNRPFSKLFKSTNVESSKLRSLLENFVFYCFPKIIFFCKFLCVLYKIFIKSER